MLDAMQNQVASLCNIVQGLTEHVTKNQCSKQLFPTGDSTTATSEQTSEEDNTGTAPSISQDTGP